MCDSAKTLSIDDACKRIEHLDIYGDAGATATFFAVVIEYTGFSLKAKGIDLLKEANQAELEEYCRMWFKECKKTDNDLALIALNYSIEYAILTLVKAR